jgi:pimeloyl-ACP methyl ester carboxylesterase
MQPDALPSGHYAFTGLTQPGVEMRDGSITVADGGTVSFTEAGALDEVPIFYCHGAPGSRLDVVWLDDAFSNVGARVVSADRPGIGRSSPSPGRTMADWPRRVIDLADHLDIDRFGVMGFSSGGPYVVACAALLSERVVGASIVAGVTDMGWSAAFDDFPEDDEKTIMRIGDEAMAHRWCVEHYGEDGARFFDSPRDLSPPDAKVREDEAMMAGLLPTFAEAFVQGVAGYAQDITVQGRGWTFDVGHIRCPVRVYHGEQDTIIPISHGRHTAEVIASATLTTLPQHGHISMITEIPAITANLASMC